MGTLLTLTFVASCLFANFLMTVVSDLVCPSEFLGDDGKKACTCGPAEYEEISSEFVTNCTNSNFKDVSKFEELPTDTEILILVGNNFPRLPPKMFGTLAKYEKLRIIDLSRNQIEIIEDGVFDESENQVEKLIINDNRWRPHTGVDVFNGLNNLQELHLSNAFDRSQGSEKSVFQLVSDSFESLKKLTLLNISNNNMHGIHDDSFLCMLPALITLDLSHNQLESVTISRRCAKRLLLIDLSYNRLTSFDLTTTAVFDSLVHLDMNLAENPFSCDCHFHETLRWMNKSASRVLDHESVTCSDGRLAGQLESKSLVCSVSPDSRSRAGLVVLGCVLVLVAGILAGLLYVKRDNVKECIKNRPIRKKFQYSTIDNRTLQAEVDV